MIEQHFRDWVISDTAIAAYVGTRVFPQYIPEDSALPAIAYSIISDQASLSMGGPTDFRTPRLQVSIVASDQPTVSSIAELVKRRINTWDALYLDMKVSSCFAEGGVYLSLDYYTPPRHGMIIECFLSWVPV